MRVKQKYYVIGNEDSDNEGELWTFDTRAEVKDFLENQDDVSKACEDDHYNTSNVPYMVIRGIRVWADAESVPKVKINLTDCDY